MSVKNALNIFAFDIVDDAKRILKQKDKNTSKNLSNSLDYKLTVSKNSFSLAFFMEDYGKFIDKGVKGIGGTKADGSKWKLKKVTNDDYKYKSKAPPARAFDKWVVKRGLAPRDSKGKFLSRKSVSFAIAKSVYHTGLETTNFFTKPFEKAFNRLPDNIVEAFGLEVDNLFNFTTKK
tara:strand:- start:10849 stop:11379 length:531 start_codon:yes stop_codon:yes gene_type:complete